jgi:hypothetical protein
MTPYDKGADRALESLGITKEAVVGSLVRAWSPGVKSFGKRFAKNFKEILIGSPIKTVQQVQAGKALAPGGLIREGFRVGKGPMGLAIGGLMYGLPAYEALKVMRSEDPDKARQLGRIIGGTAAGLGTWRAFGLLGSMLAQPIGERLGEEVGKRVPGAIGRPAPQTSTPLTPRPYATPYGAVSSAIGRPLYPPQGWV